MVRAVRALACLGVACAVLCSARFATAQQVLPRFQKHYADGERAYHSGEFDKARREFEKAREIQALPGAYRWLAAVALAQERFEDCLTEARGYLKLAGESNQAAAVRNLHAQCREKLGRPPFQGEYAGGGAIWVEATHAGERVEGAVVRLNGLRYGATPMAPRAVAPGAAEVALEEPKYLPKSVETEVVTGIVTDVIVELEKDPNAAAQADADKPREEITVGWLRFETRVPGVQVVVGDQPASQDDQGRYAIAPGLHPVRVTAPGYEPWRRRIRVARGQERRFQIELRREDDRRATRRNGYLALGVAGAAIASGVVFGLLEQDEYEAAEDIWNTETQRPGSPGAPQFVDEFPLKTREDIAEHEDAGKRYALYAGISYGVAAVALGASIYFFVAERPDAPEGFPAPLAVTPLFDGDGLTGAAASFTTEVDW